jgi:hypothetical protein
MCKRFLACLALLAAWQCCARAVLAQTALVSIKLASSSPPVRSDAPMTFVWAIQSQSSKLIEGQLDVTIHDGPEELAHGVTEDIVLTAGEHLVRTILPPIESNNQFNSLQLLVRFFSKDALLGKLETDLRAPNQWQRSLVILISDPWQSSMPTDVRQLVDHLRIETWNADKDDRTISTNPAHVRPDDLPLDPLGFCGFDVMVLTNAGFADLKESQLRPVLEWVEAGGSLFVAPGNAILKDYHASFLNRVARSSDSNPQFVLDPSGRLMASGAESESDSGEGGGALQASTAVLRRHGLGRIAIVNGPLDRLTGREADLRTTLAFLWKMRHDKLAEFIDTGKFQVASDHPVDEPKPGENEWQSRNFNVSYAKLRREHMQLAALPLQSGDQLLTRLMPEGLRVVPMSLIGIILIVYVLLIGPGDWFVLGAIKRRKWTWFTFPFVTVALTFLTVWLAEWYMQISDNRRTVTFHDLGEGGRVVRRNRFEVLFQGSERNVTTELTRELFSQMTLQRFSSAMWYNYQIQQQQGIDQRRRYNQVANFAGRVPSRYSVTQFLSQWTPQLNRRFTIPRAPASASVSSDATPTPITKATEFDWNVFADSKIYNPGTIGVGDTREALVRQIKQAFGEAAHIAVFIGGKRHNLVGDFGFFHSGEVFGIDADGNRINQQAYYPGYNPNANQSSFLEDVSVNGLGGLFAVVSQVSPTGGKDFEDMALVDPSDPDQWLLIVAVDRGAEVELYRRLYTRGD